MTPTVETNCILSQEKKGSKKKNETGSSRNGSFLERFINFRKDIEFFKPMENEKGMDPDALVHEMQRILFPVDVLIIMSEPKLTNALVRVLTLKEEKLPSLKETDVRTLIKVKETQTMMLSAEMTLRASMMRKETRENIFYREDYNKPDNKNWLKWIIAEKGRDREIIFSVEDIPFERYPFKPDV